MRSMDPEKFLNRQVRRYWGMQGLPRGIRVLVSLSGGPDSTALAIILGDLRKKLDFDIVIAHYDHGIRRPEESAADLSFSQSLAERLEVPFVHEAAPWGALEDVAGKTGRSLEEVAREYRYRFLKVAAAQNLCSHIALGHTATDRRETQIMRFFQGSAPPVLRGIPDKRGPLIRPLAGVDKKSVLAYLAHIGQDYRLDHTNEDPGFLRNHIRSVLHPAAAEVFPGYEKALDKLAVKARLYGDFVDQALEGKNPWRREAGEAWTCDFAEFLALHPLLRILSMYRLYDSRKTGKNNPRLPFAFLAPLEKLTSGRGEGVLLRGYGMRLELKKGRLCWKRDIVLAKKKGYLYVVNGETGFEAPDGLLIRVDEIFQKAPFESEVFRCGRDECLVVRSRRPGDKLQTEGGTKTLKKMFSPLGIPEEHRDLVPVVQRGRDIIGVLTAPWGFPTIRAQEKEEAHKSEPEAHGAEPRARKDDRFFHFKVFIRGEERG